ncbi:MAG: AAA family ATPase [Syntrophomonadaceae bacterium]|nr:AAA family ATPase [Syntrophomonadaceae bacterium]
MENSLKVPSEQLKNRCDYTQFEFETTEQISPLHGFMGQERARKALQFGLKIKSHGYNIFMTGISGTGKTSFARKLVREIATDELQPCDWLYVYNFKYKDKPKALCLPPGWGIKLRDSMNNLMDELKKEVPKVFTGEEYEKLKSKILEDFYAQTNEIYQELELYARGEDFTIHKTGTGLASVPLINGQPVSEEEYENLSGEIKETIQERNRRVREKMNESMWRYKELERHTKNIINQLERNLGHESIGPLISELKKQFLDFPEVVEYLNEVENDLIDNLDAFLDKEEGQSPVNVFKRFNRQSIFNRYQVNLLVDNSEVRGAPVIEEKNPTFANIFGTIEYEGEFGVLATDFTKIKTGAIHRANGGYLILQAADILKSFPIWDTLKRTLRNREVVVESIFRNLNLGGAVTLDPQPIPINLKVILIGEPYLYQLLYVYDEDFRKLFKIKADFDTEIDRSRQYMEKYAGFISSVCYRENLKHFDRTAVARVVDYSSWLAEDQNKLSTLFNKIGEIVVEAAAWADTEGADLVSIEHVDKAINEKNHRSNRIELKLHEAIQEGTLMIDTDGQVVGQVNGLAVYSLGDYAFGKPSRITAKTYMGERGVINIEREIRMSGQIHSKGVLTLMGYLGGMYAQDKPLTLSASLTFEQLYGGIEGDSASSAELFALISSLSGLPINQGIAVTGSVNQRGEIQPVGGINYKIEGFYKVCRDKGLTGHQGVIIPRQNIRNLMLDDEVIEAVQAGRFHIWAIKNVDEGLEILTGVRAGVKEKDGKFPQDTVHYLADEQLNEWGRRSRRTGERIRKSGEK